MRASLEPTVGLIPVRPVAGGGYYRWKLNSSQVRELFTLSDRPVKDIKRQGANYDEILRADRVGYLGIASVDGAGSIKYWAFPDEACTSHSAVNLPSHARFRLLSGFGQFHSNEPGAEHPKPYVSIDLPQIYDLVDEPQHVDKRQAQWIIPSTLQTRSFKAQEEHGEFWMLWADLDANPQPLSRVAHELGKILGGSDFELYTSRSALAETPKARILIPLAIALPGNVWRLAQEVLNDKLLAAGITPDRASERAAQLCYLPNRGAYYEKYSVRTGRLFSPATAWETDFNRKESELRLSEEALMIDAEATKVRRELLSLGERPDTIGAFNHAYTVQDILLRAGYAQRGDTFRHPHSQSGSYSASVREGRVHSLSSADPLYTGGGGVGAHDSFSAFCVLFAEGDLNRALKLAGDDWLAIGGEPWNKVKQREFAKQQAATQLSGVDFSGILGGATKFGSSEPNLANNLEQISKASFPFVAAKELLSKPQPVTYLIDELVEHPSLVLLFAPPSSGKSFLAISWAASIASGSPWLGAATKQGAVFYLAGEGHTGISRRLRAWEIHTGRSLADAPLFVSTVPAAMMDERGAATVESAIKDLCRDCTEPALIVIDTFARNLGDGDENSNADIGVFVNRIDQMRLRLGCSVLIVHHTGHMDKNRGRGGSALPAAMDACFLLQKKSERTIVLSQEKAKEADLSKPITLNIKQVPIDWLNGKGQEMTSAVIELIDEGGAVHAASKPLSFYQRQGIESLCQAIVDAGSEHKESEGWDGVDVEAWRTAFYRVCTADDKKKAFQRVRKDLASRGLVRMSDDIWFIPQNDPTLIGTRVMRCHHKPPGQGTEEGQGGICVPSISPA